jgi:4-diphosphocytidyl-2-C-methyl-D-erythritol kinase
MITFPACKINLGLRVLGKREDGFHNLQSVFYPVSWCDVLEIVPSKKTSLDIHGATFDLADGDNICFKAWQLIHDKYGIEPVDIHLIKGIPSGAGLGGGSSNGTATLKLLNEIFGLNITKHDLKSLAAELGSDCPFFVNDVPALVEGRGEILKETDVSLSNTWIVLMNPGIHISTAEAFAGISASKEGFDLADLGSLHISEWRNEVINDFENGVFEKHPKIQRLKEHLYSCGAFYASMTGTGSTVYGLFENDPGDIPDLDSNLYKTILI